jgi:hypothetical protein
MTTKSTPVDPAALAVPAQFVNRFQVTIVDGTLVRVSFGEALGSDADAYRAAVIMTVSNARELALSMMTMLGTTSATPS